MQSSILAVVIACLLSVHAVQAQTPASTVGNEVAASVQIPVTVLANGKPLPPGTYNVRLTGERPAPLPGQPAGAQQWVELLADGKVVARESAEVLKGEDLPAEGASSQHVQNGTRYLRGGVHLRGGGGGGMVDWWEWESPTPLTTRVVSEPHPMGENIMSTINTTTKTKAQARQAASLAAAAETLAAQPVTEAEALRAMLTAKVGTVTEALADAARAGQYVRDAEGDAFAAILLGRQVIGAKVYAAYCAAQAEAGKVAEPAASVTFAKVAASGFPVGARTKTEYGTGRHVAGRGWETLAEDYNVFLFTTSGRFRAAYDASLAEGDSPTVRGYMTFARRAASAEAEALGDDVTPQARAAVTKALSAKAAKAEAERQAAAAAKAETDRETAKADAETKAKADAAARVAHVRTFPSASAVTGCDAIPASLLTALPAKVLRDLAATCLALADVIDAETKAAAEAAKTATPAVAPIVAAGQAAAAEALAEAEAEALGDDAQAAADAAAANEARMAAEYDAFVAWRAA